MIKYYLCRLDSYDDDMSPEASHEEEEMKKPKLETDYMALISFQTFSGSWKLTEEFSKELLLDLNEIKKSAPIKVQTRNLHIVSQCI